MRRAALLLVVLLAAVGSGCGLGAEASEEDGASLLVTRDFGTRELGSGTAAELPGGETVMRLLQRDFDVETRYGGGFVHAVEGVAGGRQDGRPVDWFYYVNGILAGDGAAAHPVAPADRVWWDHHDWTATPDVFAVVGAFPEPFLSGVAGKRLPVRIDCAGDAGDACDEVSRRLAGAGVKAGRSAPGGFGGEGVLRIKVGTWAAIRRDAAVRQLEQGPGTSGVYAKPNAAGDAIELLDSRGEAESTLGAGGGLVAATKLGGEAPTWVVTGTDDIGVAAAAALLEEETLRAHFAVAVEDGRPIRLPILPPPETP